MGLRFQMLIFSGAMSLVTACDSNPAIFRHLQLSTGEEIIEKDGGATYKSGADEAIVTDAKQRVITRTTFRGENALNSNRISPKVITCAEPSPDVAQAISDSITASLGVVIGGGKSVDASFARATAESIAQLGERIATVQLLRDELSDLCRSYANGAVTATTYTLRLSKLDRKMVTLMIGEMTAGAFGRTLAQIGGSAGADTGQVDEAKLQEAQENVKNAQGEVEKHRAALESITPEEDADGKKRQEAQKNLTEATKTLHGALQVELAVRRGQLAVNAGGSASFGIGSIARQIQTGDGTTATQMALIQRQFMEQDDVSTLVDACLTSMDILRRRSADQGTLVPLDLLEEATGKSEKQRARIEELRAELSTISEDLPYVEQRYRYVKDNKKDLGESRALSESEAESLAASLSARISVLYNAKDEKLDLLGKAESELGRLTEQEEKLRSAYINQGKETPLSPLGEYCAANLPTLVTAATGRHSSVTEIRKQELTNSGTEKLAVLEKVKAERLKAEEAASTAAVASATAQGTLESQRLKVETLVSCRAYMQSTTPASFPASVQDFCEKNLKKLTPP